MTITQAHDRLAEKFMYRQYWQDALVPDSMRSLVALAYTEEEAELVLALSLAPLPATIVARRVRRPVHEVKPLLRSLGERLLITSMRTKGVETYGFLNFVPGVFEAQMIRSKTLEHDPAQQAFFRQFAAYYEQCYDEMLLWLRPRMEGKTLRFGRIIPIGKAVDSSPSVVPLTTDSFAETIDRNNSFCLVEVCACRHEMALLGKGCDNPRDVCSAMGWLADFVIEKGLARRVSKQEYIAAKDRAAEAGLVHMTDNLADPLQVCSCCTCCCSALRILKQYNIPNIISASRFEAVVEESSCTACGLCARACPMDAISVTKKQPPAVVDYTRCIGCGVCVPACKKANAMTLRERPRYQPPSETVFDYFADRYLEVNGPAGAAVGPKLKLGVARILGKLSPVHPSGPRYKG